MNNNKLRQWNEVKNSNFTQLINYYVNDGVLEDPFEDINIIIDPAGTAFSREGPRPSSCKGPRRRPRRKRCRACRGSGRTCRRRVP